MILIIDDEPYIRSSLSGLLSDEGYRVEAVATAERGEEILSAGKVALILLDIQMPGKDGITFLADNRERLQDIPVIVISGRGDIATAVAAIKLGAYDYIEKPLGPERVLVTVKHALRLAGAAQSERKLVAQILDRYEIVGRSSAILAVRQMIDKAAATDATVLITGENGIGKELVAHHIHYRSARKAEPLVTVNCPAIPEPLFESELFGHVKGAFTGAYQDRVGRFEAAHKGTLFLDEIGDLPLSVQGKLLRGLETGRFEKIGSDVTVAADCRLIAATNRDLLQMITAGSFREDLFYRLNVITIRVPPLRERPDDVALLSDHFLEKLGVAEQYRLSPEAVGILASQPWPGNVRQLHNCLQQIVFSSEPGEIGATDALRICRGREDDAAAELAPDDNRLTTAVRQFETGYLTQLHRKHDGNIAAMARELGMDRGNLSRKLKSLGIV
jgi:two-component system nitrogen regulation response regulator NtrX